MIEDCHCNPRTDPDAEIVQGRSTSPSSIKMVGVNRRIEAPRPSRKKQGDSFYVGERIFFSIHRSDRIRQFTLGHVMADSAIKHTAIILPKSGGVDEIVRIDLTEVDTKLMDTGTYLFDLFELNDDLRTGTLIDCGAIHLKETVGGRRLGILDQVTASPSGEDAIPAVLTILNFSTSDSSDPGVDGIEVGSVDSVDGYWIRVYGLTISLEAAATGDVTIQLVNSEDDSEVAAVTLSTGEIEASVDLMSPIQIGEGFSLVVKLTENAGLTGEESLSVSVRTAISR